MAVLADQVVVAVGLILLLAELVEQELQGKALLVEHPQVLQIMAQAVVAVLPESVQVLLVELVALVVLEHPIQFPVLL
jgi:hypothetical protein